jgi:hypothetical protein
LLYKEFEEDEKYRDEEVRKRNEEYKREMFNRNALRNTVRR